MSLFGGKRSAPSQAPAWEGLGGVKESLLLPALRNGSFASNSVTKQSFVTSGLGGEVAELAVSAVTLVGNAHVRSLRLNPPAPFYKGGINRLRRATPARLSLNLFIIMKPGRGARSPWRTPDPEIGRASCRERV